MWLEGFCRGLTIAQWALDGGGMGMEDCSGRSLFNPPFPRFFCSNGSIALFHCHFSLVTEQTVVKLWQYAEERMINNTLEAGKRFDFSAADMGLHVCLVAIVSIIPSGWGEGMCRVPPRSFGLPSCALCASGVPLQHLNEGSINKGSGYGWIGKHLCVCVFRH